MGELGNRKLTYCNNEQISIKEELNDQSADERALHCCSLKTLKNILPTIVRSRECKAVVVSQKNTEYRCLKISHQQTHGTFLNKKHIIENEERMYDLAHLLFKISDLLVNVTEYEKKNNVKEEELKRMLTIVKTEIMKSFLNGTTDWSTMNKITIRIKYLDDYIKQMKGNQNDNDEDSNEGVKKSIEEIKSTIKPSSKLMSFEENSKTRETNVKSEDDKGVKKSIEEERIKSTITPSSTLMSFEENSKTRETNVKLEDDKGDNESVKKSIEEKRKNEEIKSTIKPSSKIMSFEEKSKTRETNVKSEDDKGVEKSIEEIKSTITPSSTLMSFKENSIKDNSKKRKTYGKLNDEEKKRKALSKEKLEEPENRDSIVTLRRTSNTHNLGPLLDHSISENSNVYYNKKQTYVCDNVEISQNTFDPSSSGEINSDAASIQDQHSTMSNVNVSLKSSKLKHSIKEYNKSDNYDDISSIDAEKVAAKVCRSKCKTIQTDYCDRCCKRLSSGKISLTENERNASLRNASLPNASLTNASLPNASLTNASVTNASLTNASLRNASLRNVSLPNASLTDASLPNASLTNASLTNASLRNASLPKAPVNSYMSVSTLNANSRSISARDGLIQNEEETINNGRLQSSIKEQRSAATSYDDYYYDPDDANRILPDKDVIWKMRHSKIVNSKHWKKHEIKGRMQTKLNKATSTPKFKGDKSKFVDDKLSKRLANKYPSKDNADYQIMSMTVFYSKTHVKYILPHWMEVDYNINQTPQVLCKQNLNDGVAMTTYKADPDGTIHFNLAFSSDQLNNQLKTDITIDNSSESLISKLQDIKGIWMQSAKALYETLNDEYQKKCNTKIEYR